MSVSFLRTGVLGWTTACAVGPCRRAYGSAWILEIWPREWDLGFRRPVAQLAPAPAVHQTHDAARDGHETAVALIRGQTMVEYALIIAAIGVVAWGAYSVMGHNIGSMASGIDSSLTST
jgi:Flp pilus assembly pilin Flp